MSFFITQVGLTFESIFYPTGMAAETFFEYRHGLNPFANGFSGQADVSFKERNEMLLNFAYIVSHNLRSHASNLSTLLRIFNETSSEEERKKLFEYVVGISDQLCATVKNLGKVVCEHETSGEKFETVNIRQKIDDAAEILTVEIDQQGATIYNGVPHHINIQYIPAYFESIVLNFMSNAIKYRHPQRRPEVLFEITKEDGFLVLEVSDNGIGIDLQKYGDKLFGRNQTFHQHKDAHGIGLYMTKNQVESLGGRIEVCSNVGQGTTFKIFFQQE